MAEGWTQFLWSSRYEPFSAGTEPKQVDPLAVKVMAEAGIDISQHRSKGVNELAGLDFDFVVTVCDNARERCPVFPGAKRLLHAGFDDPPALARDIEPDREVLDIYRRVRDEIRVFVENLPRHLNVTNDKGTIWNQ
jgi:arsenate reductase